MTSLMANELWVPMYVTLDYFLSQRDASPLQVEARVSKEAVRGRAVALVADASAKAAPVAATRSFMLAKYRDRR